MRTSIAATVFLLEISPVRNCKRSPKCSVLLPLWCVKPMSGLRIQAVARFRIVATEYFFGAS